MRGCIMLHSKPVKYGTGVMAIIKQITPLLEEEGYYLDFLITTPEKRNLPQWLTERNVIPVKRDYKPLPARGFGVQGQGVQMFFENLNFYRTLFERLQTVHYDFVFCLGSNGFHLLSMYGVNKHLPLWCDMNLEAWDNDKTNEMKFLYGLDNVWVSAHEALEPMLKEKLNANAVFKTTFGIDLADENNFENTEDRICIIGNKRADKTPDIEKLDENLQGKLVWLSGMPQAPELKHGKSYAMLRDNAYTDAIRNCRYGVVLSRYECLGVAILEQAAVQPVFIRDYGDWRSEEWTKIHEVLPTWSDYGELRTLMLQFSQPDKWQQQVDKQRQYIAELFTVERLKEMVSAFCLDIKPAERNDVSFTGTKSVEDILSDKGWNDGVGALGYFRKMKANGIRSVETGNKTLFTDDINFEPIQEESIDLWEAF